jgi:hypothetical protein
MEYSVPTVLMSSSNFPIERSVEVQESKVDHIYIYMYLYARAISHLAIHSQITKHSYNP